MLEPSPGADSIDDALRDRCAPIRLLVLDVDGVLTDGVIALDDRGVEMKRFFVRDGSALSLWRKAGHRAAILSGRWAPAVERRAAELGLAPVIQGAKDKGPRFETLMAHLDLEPKQVCYVGDDLPDLPVLRLAGLSACPADAVPEVRDACHLVSPAPGGRGAVRAIVETILKAQGRWSDLVGLSDPDPMQDASGGRRGPPPRGHPRL